MVPFLGTLFHQMSDRTTPERKKILRCGFLQMNYTSFFYVFHVKQSFWIVQKVVYCDVIVTSYESKLMTKLVQKLSNVDENCTESCPSDILYICTIIFRHGMWHAV